MKKIRLLPILLLSLAVISFIMFFVSRNNQEYTIVFDSNGGSFVENQKVKYHQNVIKPNDPIRENYLFEEWQHNGIKYDFNQEVEENILLTASWQEKQLYKVVITLDGVGYESKFYEGNVINIENYTLPPKEGYKIVLYQNEKIFELSTPVTKDINLEAKYEKNS